MDGSSKLFMRRCYGYTHNQHGELIIQPEEAEIVRFIFKQYLRGASIVGIKKLLESKGDPSPTGKTVWCNGTIDKMLSNEKYIGDVMIFKTITIGHPERKRVKNMGQSEQYLCASQHPAIISRQDFDTVQTEKKRRCNIVEDENGRHRAVHKYSSQKTDVTE